MAGGVESESRHVTGQGEVVVDRLGNVDDAQFAVHAFRHEPSAQGRIIAADGQLMRDAHSLQTLANANDPFPIGLDPHGGLELVAVEQAGSRRAEDGAAFKVDAAHPIDV